MERLLITGARAPAALYIARLMHQAGHFVVLADSLRHTLGSRTNACATYEVLPRSNDGLEGYGQAVRTVIDRHQITHVIPTCEEIFHLAQLWQSGEMGADLFAPDFQTLSRVHNKFDFATLAKGLGLNVPETKLLENMADLEAVRQGAGDLVFKPVWSRFGTQVLVRPKPDALRIEPSAETPWVAQNHVAGDELCTYAIAHHGVVTAVSTYRPRYRAGSGAGTFFDPVDNPQVQDFVARFVAGTNWTGQIAIDFIQTQDGSVWAIECNPRAVSGVHFFQDAKAFSGTLLHPGGDMTPSVVSPQALHLAMMFYGLGGAVKAGEVGGFIRDFRAAENVLDWPNDPRPRRGQLRALAEIAGIAIRQRCSLQAAATADIEWNGPKT